MYYNYLYEAPQRGINCRCGWLITGAVQRRRHLKWLEYRQQVIHECLVGITHIKRLCICLLGPILVGQDGGDRPSQLYQTFEHIEDAIPSRLHVLDEFHGLLIRRHLLLSFVEFSRGQRAVREVSHESTGSTDAL